MRSPKRPIVAAVPMWALDDEEEEIQERADLILKDGQANDPHASEAPLALTSPNAADLARRKKLLTACEFCAFFCLGLLLAILGPTLLDLGHQTGSTVGQMGYVFTARSIGYLIGSIFGGNVVERFPNVSWTLAVCMITCGIACLVTPMMTHVMQLGICVFILGLFMGAIDTCGNVLLIKVWGGDVGPFMQALHFSFGLGAFIAPLLASEFLGSSLPTSISNCTGYNLTFTTEAPPLTELPVNNSINGTGLVPEDFEDTNVRYAYWICTALLVPIGVWYIQLAYSAPSGGECTSHEDEGDHTAYRRTGPFRRIVLILTFLLYIVYCGIEVAFGAWIFTYGVKYCPLQMDEEKAAYLTSMYWGSFAAGRLVAIPLSIKVPPGTMLLIDLFGAIAASAVMMIQSHSEHALWVSTAVFGFSLSSMFPSGMHLVEEFIDVTGSAASLIVVASALGEMLFPLIVGALFDNIGPLTMMQFIFAACIAALSLFVVLYCWGTSGVKKFKRQMEARRKHLIDGDSSMRGDAMVFAQATKSRDLFVDEGLERVQMKTVHMEDEDSLHSTSSRSLLAGESSL